LTFEELFNYLLEKQTISEENVVKYFLFLNACRKKIQTFISFACNKKKREREKSNFELLAITIAIEL